MLVEGVVDEMAEIWSLTESNSKKDMLNIKYEAPTGYKKHNRLWNGGTGYGTLRLYKRAFPGSKWVLIDKVRAEGVGCEYGEYCDPE